MLTHHSSTDYNVAASAAASAARDKMDAIIAKGRGRAGAVIEQVMTQVVSDNVVPAHTLKFLSGKHGIDVLVKGDNLSLHRNALRQMAAEIDMPVSYADTLASKGEWGNNLLAENFGRNFAHMGHNKRNLVRSVGTEVRGFLSDKYRRLDSRPIIEAFAGAVQNIGAVPVEGYALDTKVALKAALPMIFEPVPNEVMLFGLSLENSDFGNGALSLRSFCLRLWCTNFAIAEEAMRQIHLGKRLGDDVSFSSRTYELDTQTTASAVNDLVGKLLGAGTVNQYVDAVKVANDEKIDTKKALEALRKDLTKAETELVKEAFTSADVEMMPAGNTAWRLSNAISWVAGNKVENEERKLDLMKVAGKVAGFKLAAAA